MSFWWLSFCDPKRPRGDRFMGACIVKGGCLEEALRESWRQGCNPGGEVLSHEVPPEYEHNVEHFGVNALLSKDTISTIEERIIASEGCQNDA